MHVDMWDIWERTETGPICPAKDFDLKVVAAKTRELVKKYEITYDPEQIVPTDDDLIDRIYEAGVELLAETGVLCADTEKIIQFTRGEIEDTLDLYPGRLTLGEGNEAVEWVHRGIEDPRKPRIIGGMVAGAVSEDIMPRVYEAYAREAALDVFAPGTPSTVRGKVVKPGTPLEMYAEKLHVATIREAFRRAGRPGIATTGTHYIADMAPVAAMQPRYYRPSDCLILVLEVQMKVNLGKLCFADAIHDYGARCFGTGTGFIGGLFGGPEGTAIGLVAETLAAYMVYRPDLCGIFAADMIYGPGSNDRKPLWISTHAQAALAKNTKLVWQMTGPYACHAGAGTEMYFREMAVGSVAQVPCGGNPSHGSGGDGIGLDSFGGPLDVRFVRDVTHAATKLTRAEANGIVQALLAKTETRVKARDPEKGKTFQELNDLDTLQPTPEHVALYEQMKKELGDLGLDFAEKQAPDLAGVAS
jgi:methylamine--corrinoid protein Co-methyltransferase